jgi:hypothetical protein
MENYTFLRESAITPDGREQLEALGLNLLLLITVYSTSLDLNLQFLMDYPFQKQEGLISVTLRLKSKVGQPTTSTRAPPRKKRRVLYNEALEDIRRKKEQLIDLEIYKRRLEILELENRLQLQPSAYTKDLPVMTRVEELIVLQPTANTDSE